MFIEKLRNLWAKTRNTPQGSRDDAGFSFAQVIVTMVIVGILGGAIGFTAFEFIGQSRETVLAANIRTAAEAVQNSLALNPNLKEEDAVPDIASGKASGALISELANVAGFNWKTTGAEAAADGWVLEDDDGAETVHIQFLADGTGAGAAQGDATSPADAADAPTVGWMVGDRDAVRLQITNEDEAWACALVVLRPDWAAGTKQATVEGTLRGIWYDAGSEIDDDDGLHNCSPTTVANVDASGGSYGNTNAGDSDAAATKEPLPADGSTWDIPVDGSNAARSFQRTVPAFSGG